MALTPRFHVEYRERWDADGSRLDPDIDKVTMDGRPVLLIDPDNVEQIQSMIDAAKRYSGPGDASVVQRWQWAVRELIDPKPYREHPGNLSAPWPVVNECHSRHVAGHECPQCAWEHEHDWVAWVHPTGSEWPPNAIPIRCSKCGGRKCDLDRCPEQRHTHNHQDIGGLAS